MVVEEGHKKAGGTKLPAWPCNDKEKLDSLAAPGSLLRFNLVPDGVKHFRQGRIPRALPSFGIEIALKRARRLGMHEGQPLQRPVLFQHAEALDPLAGPCRVPNSPSANAPVRRLMDERGGTPADFPLRQVGPAVAIEVYQASARPMRIRAASPQQASVLHPPELAFYHSEMAGVRLLQQVEGAAHAAARKAPLLPASSQTRIPSTVPTSCDVCCRRSQQRMSGIIGTKRILASLRIRTSIHLSEPRKPSENPKRM